MGGAPRFPGVEGRGRYLPGDLGQQNQAWKRFCQPRRSFRTQLWLVLPKFMIHVMYFQSKSH